MAGGEHQEKPISLFYSYSHSDEELRKELENQLAALRWSGLISEWHDRNIDVGDEWAKEIDRNLSSADIILLLVSANFIASQYCWSVEMKKALERHDKGEAKVIPVILRPCSWHITPFAKLQAAPTDAKPVTSWPDQDTALYDVARKIERAVTDLQQQRRRAAEQAQQRAEEARKRQAAEEKQRALQRQREQEEARTSGTRSTRPAPPGENRSPAWLGDHAWVTAAAEGRHVVEQFAVFRDVDAPWCPELVVLPAGEFLMGSPEKEEGRYDNEGPQHRVTIEHRFALGRYLVTVGEYRRFVEASGHRHEGGMHVWTGSAWKQDEAKSWRDPGFAQTDRHPVVGVSWRDAAAYSEWLGRETGKPYRLPSEAEWEYACRAGTTTPFSFGGTITTDQANYDGNYVYGNGRKGVYRQRTTEVGSFPANPWGLHDMHGNVWEWAEDVWHGSYNGAPADGSAWMEGEGKQSSRLRVNRGGSWDLTPRGLRSADRSGYLPVVRGISLGFRVARTLD